MAKYDVDLSFAVWLDKQHGGTGDPARGGRIRRRLSKQRRNNALKHYARMAGVDYWEWQFGNGPARGPRLA